MLKEEPLILYNTDSVLNKTLLALFENAGLKPNILLYAVSFTRSVPSSLIISAVLFFILLY